VPGHSTRQIAQAQYTDAVSCHHLIRLRAFDIAAALRRGPQQILVVLAAVSIGAACAIGIVVASAIRLVATGPLEYFSTVTRADAILVGCVVALVRPRWPSSVAVAGVVALVIVALLDPVHDIAIPVAMVATAAVIGGRFEPLGVLAPLGLRAYSLYLWNWPMTLLFGSIGAIAPLLTFVVGEISYRLLEAPVLHRGGKRAVVPPVARVLPVQPQA